MEYLAHSARPDQGIPVQIYGEHITETRRLANNNADATGKYCPKYSVLLKAVSALAGEYHDFGKLDDENQAVLSGAQPAKRLPVQHVDAGVVHLLQTDKQCNKLAAFVCYSHHIGLQSLPKEKAKGKHCFRDEENPALLKHTEESLHAYITRHRSCVLDTPIDDTPNIGLSEPQVFLRMALSCLANADHSDTARHYGEIQGEPVLLRATERLTKLDRCITELGSNVADQRVRQRNAVYADCRNADTNPKIYACDSPVGSGKTFAVMAYLLKVAAEKGLRRIFVVLPYTSIIEQSVKEYRRALVLEGENPDEVVAEHHHRADFSSSDVRCYTTLWQAPIVVTTAVQFFETLASNAPGALRKLHQVPGSAIFLDEAHAALPAKLWPQAWKWLTTLGAEWGCRFVLGSGSLTRFWELGEFVNPPARLPELVISKTRESMLAVEGLRVRYCRRADLLGLNEILKWLPTLPGPRLLIGNTVQSAAVIAQAIATRFGRRAVEHLSTALTPADREKTLWAVKSRLGDKHDNEWTLVATSLVEAGMDFSFRTGFREAAGLVNLIQLGGRINRHLEYSFSEVWTFQLKEQDNLRAHRDFELAAKVLDGLFEEGRVSPDDCKEALRREIRKKGLADPISQSESACDFPKVAEEFQVISGETCTAVVDEDLKERLHRRERVLRRDIQRGSVQIWGNRIAELQIPEFSYYPGLYFWTLSYDTFIGYMKGILDDKAFLSSGGAIV